MVGEVEEREEELMINSNSINKKAKVEEMIEQVLNIWSNHNTLRNQIHSNQMISIQVVILVLPVEVESKVVAIGIVSEVVVPLVEMEPQVVSLNLNI